jgi:hypothetical protein
MCPNALNAMGLIAVIFSWGTDLFGHGVFTTGLLGFLGFSEPVHHLCRIDYLLLDFWC